jgi:alkyl sulfatase BDS1-like metallo-beta-lactamase superfamily hydrolase
MRSARIAVLGCLLALAAACGRKGPPPGASGADAQGHTAPTGATVRANAAVARSLPLDDPRDFEDARRGLIAGEGDVVVKGADGHEIWDTAAYAFEKGPAPDSVNPSLWRQAKINAIHGLFEVTDGVYQVRGYDLSNMTLIQGRSGWILVDPLTSRETAAAALALARKSLGPVPIVAVIFTHSHVDHFGGIAGVLPAEEALPGRLRIIAPRGFMEAATSENVLAGIAMRRRSAFMYGLGLARSPRGHVDSGLGKAPAIGSVSILEPTDLVDHTPQPMEIDGVPFVFQYAPNSEAPAELAFYLPEKKAYCAAELATHNLHNLYTLRGAKIRDALSWSGYLDEALRLFPDAQLEFASHHWPVWGHDRVVDLLEKQRDGFLYIHDQTLRLANEGATPDEIAETLVLPPALATAFPERDYYGTVRANAKAVYQEYFGWYDGNPAHLDPLPPVDAGRRYVAAMGGAAAVLRQARAAFDAADYRWAATLLDHLVFAEPKNAEARELLARTYDQLGYQAESGPWRDEYLTGADELRHGTPRTETSLASAAGLLEHLPVDLFFASMAVRLDGPKAEDKDLTLNFVFTDVGRTVVVRIQNGVLHHHLGDPDPGAVATVHLTRDFLVRLATGQAGLRDLVFSKELAVDGSRLQLLSFFSLLDRPAGAFPIVTP